MQRILARYLYFVNLVVARICFITNLFATRHTGQYDCANCRKIALCGLFSPFSHFLEIGLDSKKELVNKDTFEGGDVVLLVEQKHRFFIIYRIYRSEGYRAVAVGN